MSRTVLWRRVVVVCTIVAALGCSRQDVQLQRRLARSTDVISSLHDKRSEAMKSMLGDLLATLRGATDESLQRTRLAAGCMSIDEDGVRVVVYWVGKEPVADYIAVGDAEGSPYYPLMDAHLKSNLEDCRDHVHYYASLMWAKGTPEWQKYSSLGEGATVSVTLAAQRMVVSDSKKLRVLKGLFQ